MRGLAEPFVGGAHGVAFPTQVHQRARSGSKGSPGSGPGGSQQGEGEEDPERHEVFSAVTFTLRRRRRQHCGRCILRGTPLVQSFSSELAGLNEIP
jgi:hypothetical protein